MPRPVIRGKQVLDAISAYQMIHIAEGVIQRGTATVLRDLDRPMFGKTGTNTGPPDVWFIGGTTQMIAGVFIGYDIPHSLGGAAQGGSGQTAGRRGGRRRYPGWRKQRQSAGP